MKVIADENIDADIIAWLRDREVDVFSVREMMQGAIDSDVLKRSNLEGRILLTKDMDFGELIFHGHLQADGVILLRMKSAGAMVRLAAVQLHWPEVEKRAPGHFLVVSQDRIRVRPIKFSS